MKKYVSFDIGGTNVKHGILLSVPVPLKVKM